MQGAFTHVLLSVLSNVQGQVHVAVQKLLAANPGKVGSITTTGHSLGGALASMCAFDIAWSGINRDGDEQWGHYIPVTAFTFEAPRVGKSLVSPVIFSSRCCSYLESASCGQTRLCTLKGLTAQEILVLLLH